MPGCGWTRSSPPRELAARHRRLRALGLAGHASTRAASPRSASRPAPSCWRRTAARAACAPGRPRGPSRAAPPSASSSARTAPSGRIQRYYDSATWPFTSGVACSLLPVSCTIGASDLPFASLRDLRRSLAERGVPSSDVFIRGGAFDLSQERDLLGLSERVVLEHFARGAGRPHDGWLEVGAGLPGRPLGAPGRPRHPPGRGRHRPRRDRGRARRHRRPERAWSARPWWRSAWWGRTRWSPPGLTLRHRAVFGAVSEAGPGGDSGARGRADARPDRRVLRGAGRRGRSPARLSASQGRLRRDRRRPGPPPAEPAPARSSPLLVKLESKGPVFYRDRREGKGGRVFDCLKFRTMCAGADAQQRELCAEEPGRRAAVQDGPRSPGHAPRPDPAQAQPGRAAPAHQRAPPRDEPRRAPALALPREPAVHPLAGRAAVRAAGHHGALAGLPEPPRRRATSISGSISTCSTSGTCRSSSTSRSSPPPS